MRHHFGDFLEREGGYWTILPNRDRYAYRIGDVPAGSAEVTIVTIGKADEHWRRVLTLPNLQELTLHEPTQEQLCECAQLSRVQRFRISHARPNSLEFIATMVGVEELVMEYVSGFSDISPLRALPRLRSLHVENLRRVSNFGGLGSVRSLKYLAIYGTLDWKQPIDDFEFLNGLENLEVLSMWEVRSRAGYPALLPVTRLKKLKRLRIHGSYFSAEEYALLEEGLDGVEGAEWGAYRVWAQAQIEVGADDLRSRLPEEVVRSNHPEVIIRHDGKRVVDDPASQWFEFTGKGAGRVKCTSAGARARCEDYAARYAAMRERARRVLAEDRR